MNSTLHSTTVSFTLFIISATLLNACGSRSSENADSAKAAPAVLRKLEILPAEVRDARGCLNLGLVFERIQQMPDGTHVREVTTGFRNGDSTEGRPRTNFLRGLALKAFVFNETLPAEISRPRLVQLDCEKVIAQAPYGDAVEAQIETWTGTSLDLVYESRREHYELLSPTTLKIVRTGRAMDDCNRQRVLVPVETTTLLRWDATEKLERQNEELGFNFVQLFTEALNEAPLELGRALRAAHLSEDGSKIVELDPRLLRDLNSIEETVTTKRCSELPEATPTPAPTPSTNTRPQAPKPRSIVEIFWDWLTS